MKRANKQIHYPIPVATRIDELTWKELDDIALFDRKKVATWLRDLIVDAVKRYQRNPQYKRFQRELEEREKKRR